MSVRHDAVILSGGVGRHGAIILAVARLAFDPPSRATRFAQRRVALLAAGVSVPVLRDHTRRPGDLPGEIAEARGVLSTSTVRSRGRAGGACEMGSPSRGQRRRAHRLVPADEAEKAVAAMRTGRSAGRWIWPVGDEGRTRVLRSKIGANRLVDMLSGATPHLLNFHHPPACATAHRRVSS